MQDRLKRSSRSDARPHLDDYVIKRRRSIDDPMMATVQCRSDYSVMQARGNAALYTILQNVAEIAYAFDLDHGAWKKFMRDDYWLHEKKRYRPRERVASKASNASFVLRYIIQERNGHHRKMAWTYARILDYFSAERVARNRIADELRKHGVNATLQLAIQKYPRRLSMAEKELEQDVAALADMLAEDEAKRTKKRTKKGTEKSAEKDTEQSRRTPAENDCVSREDDAPKKTRVLVIRVTSELLRRVREFDAGTRLRIDAVRLDDDAEGGPAMRMTSIKRKRRAGR